MVFAQTRCGYWDTEGKGGMDVSGGGSTVEGRVGGARWGWNDTQSWFENGNDRRVVENAMMRCFAY